MRFEAVSFSYDDDRRVLEDVSFEVRPGEMVAIVGLTGAGKTTIANLIPRFFEPSQRARARRRGGRLEIFAAIAARTDRAGPAGTGAVQRHDCRQHPLWPAPGLRRGSGSRRARRARSRVRPAPAAGYQTPWRKPAATLSGGERQRLGIARALLKNAPILILDEPTSSLDAISEAAVFDALRRLRRGRTTLVIAHRLSTIRDATRILVLHEGRLTGAGDA